jgi:hypothetical protein
VLLTCILVVFIEVIGALELYCPRLMTIIMCVGLKMFLGGRRAGRRGN